MPIQVRALRSPGYVARGRTDERSPGIPQKNNLRVGASLTASAAAKSASNVRFPLGW